MEHYDLIIIGGGPGGYVAAIRAAQMGMKTALAENRELGGTCLNRGCIPTKTLMHAANCYRETAHFAALGLSAADVGFDFGKVHARKNEVVSSLRGGVEQLMKANKIQILCGKGSITAPGEVTVEDIAYGADRILIATGSTPSKPPIPGIELPNLLTSDEILTAGEPVYRNLVIMGGGVIGVEMAGIYAAFGCHVTIIEAMERILPAMDREISQNLSMILKKRGIELFTSSRVEHISERDGALCCAFSSRDKKLEAYGDAVLVSTGRRPNTAGLFGSNLSVETQRGFILVDERFRTSMEGVYAVGDVIGGMQLAHKAEAEGIAAVEAMAGKTPALNTKIVPACIYTDPEIAAVGMTADEAKKSGINVKTGKYVMSGNAKSVIEGQERGFIKLVFDAETDIILGAQLMCARATDLICALTTAVANSMTRGQLMAGIYPHPTFSEGIAEALEAVDGHSIHSAPSIR